ncbi:unnamed protein product [Vitrella brassicaformis CCMP3155]|uniref:Uncharacterized protein n=1 Tax=Vitrella brassicaformis (strain CCMP3155) TaxID=1169540 RepID=A0A0G4ELR2_VITBC|nr:unnamed protein product [Vitrella brassicaformis CCMP3155]|eukprot:CEL98368.1 unnamed protein product [Vitrella brassicaformis CCMP3155]
MRTLFALALIGLLALAAAQELPQRRCPPHDCPTPPPTTTTPPPTTTTPPPTTTTPPPTTTPTPKPTKRPKYPHDKDGKCCLHCHILDHECWKYECSFSACLPDKRHVEKTTPPPPTPKPDDDKNCCWDCHAFDLFCWTHSCGWDWCDDKWAEQNADQIKAIELQLQACTDLKLTEAHLRSPSAAEARERCLTLENNIIASRQANLN